MITHYRTNIQRSELKYEIKTHEKCRKTQDTYVFIKKTKTEKLAQKRKINGQK